MSQPSIEPYDLDLDPDPDRDRLDDALAEASGWKTTDRFTITVASLEVRPRPDQAEMLSRSTSSGWFA